MKVKELIDKLQVLSDETEIYNVDISWNNLFVTVDDEFGERYVRRYINHER